MKILISPGNVQNAKSYPHWIELTRMMVYDGHDVDRIIGIMSEKDIIDKVNWCDVWISIDSFLPHLVTYHRLKSGIVIWGKSDPLIFGYKSNVNLLKDRKYLKPEQFRWWMDEPHDPDVFLDPESVYREIKKWGGKDGD